MKFYLHINGVDYELAPSASLDARSYADEVTRRFNQTAQEGERFAIEPAEVVIDGCPTTLLVDVSLMWAFAVYSDQERTQLDGSLGV